MYSTLLNHSLTLRFYSIAPNQQQSSIMYHDMGYPSHSYANYLVQYESNAYSDSVHYMHHLTAIPVPPQPPIPPPPPYVNNDPMHHHHLAMMQSQENQTWYQPPIAVTPHADHRYTETSKHQSIHPFNQNKIQTTNIEKEPKL